MTPTQHTTRTSTGKSDDALLLAAQNKKIVTEFIESVWNTKDLSSIDNYISDRYHDFSFPPTVPPTKAGLHFWIKNTSQAFDHTTRIESAVAEGDDVALRISFTVKHTGNWRNTAATGRATTVKGFRFFTVKDGKIDAHWALLDGEALQTALTDHHQGCALNPE